MNSDCPAGSDAGSPIIHILEGYLAELEGGVRPDPEALLARHPECADELRAYLDKLDLLHQAATGMREPPLTEGPGTPAGLPWERLGDFHLVREVGRGGMGIVYEARQISLERRVALKVLPFAAALDAKQLQRFKKEAQAAAHLHHSHIVPIFAVGADQGVPYYAMQFIEGQTLAALIRDLRQQGGTPVPSTSATARLTGDVTPHEARSAAPAPPTSASSPRPARDAAFFAMVARMGAEAAEALEHAHQQGIIHRDVKPANLMVDARGHLWVTDFGLALCEGEGGLTLTGDLVGTLRYMSPEQALGKRGLVDKRTDVYSLGVTLYELLTLEPAFPGDDRQEVLRRIAFEDPVPPRRRNPAVPADLETVVLKAMAREPGSRYPTAQALAEDLRRFLEHRPILARPPSLWERTAKWARRHQAAVASAAALLVVAVVGLVVSTILIWREQGRTMDALARVQEHYQRTLEKEAEAQAERQRAEANFRKACANLTQLLMLLEEKRWSSMPQINELRRAVAEQSTGFFQSFLNETSEDPAVRLQTGRAYMVLASVHTMQGNAAEAEKACRKAIAFFEGLCGPGCPLVTVSPTELAGCYISLGVLLHDAGRTEEAAAEFARAESWHQEAVQQWGDPRSLNNLAWFWVTCPQARFRRPAEAVALAQQAIDKAPRNGHLWNTLGVAHYRNGAWQAAVDALRKSMEFREGGDSNDWFFLAMAYWQLGDRDSARSWYDKALQAVNKSPIYEPLSPYRQEAEALLGVSAGAEEDERS